MNWIEKLTQDHLKMILMDAQEKGENLEIDDVKDMIKELKKQIVITLMQQKWEIERYEESV